MHSPAAPAGVIDLLDRAIRLFRDHFGLALRIVALLLVPLNLLLALTLELTMGPLYPVVRDLGRDLSKLVEAVSAFGGMQVFLASFSVTSIYFLLYSLLAPLATGALILALEASRRGRPADVRGAYRALLPMIGTFLGVVVLKGSIILMGFLFCVLPGIVLALLWSLAEVLVLVEGRSALEALGRSQELMREMPTLLRMLGMRLFLFVMSFVAGQIGNFGYVLVTGDGPGSFFSWTLLSAIPEILLLPLDVAALLMFYDDLRVRNEAFDLELEAARLGLVEEEPARGGDDGPATEREP